MSAAFTATAPRRSSPEDRSRRANAPSNMLEVVPEINGSAGSVRFALGIARNAGRRCWRGGWSPKIRSFLGVSHAPQVIGTSSTFSLALESASVCRTRREPEVAPQRRQNHLRMGRNPLSFSPAMLGQEGYWGDIAYFHAPITDPGETARDPQTIEPPRLIC